MSSFSSSTLEDEESKLNSFYMSSFKASPPANEQISLIAQHQREISSHYDLRIAHLEKLVGTLESQQFEAKAKLAQLMKVMFRKDEKIKLLSTKSWMKIFMSGNYVYSERTYPTLSQLMVEQKQVQNTLRDTYTKVSELADNMLDLSRLENRLSHIESLVFDLEAIRKKENNVKINQKQKRVPIYLRRKKRFPQFGHSSIQKTLSKWRGIQNPPFGFYKLLKLAILIFMLLYSSVMLPLQEIHSIITSTSTLEQNCTCIHSCKSDHNIKTGEAHLSLNENYRKPDYGVMDDQVKNKVDVPFENPQPNNYVKQLTPKDILDAFNKLIFTFSFVYEKYLTLFEKVATLKPNQHII